jgi:hypothetical protein
VVLVAALQLSLSEPRKVVGVPYDNAMSKLVALRAQPDITEADWTAYGGVGLVEVHWQHWSAKETS